MASLRACTLQCTATFMSLSLSSLLWAEGPPVRLAENYALSDSLELSEELAGAPIYASLSDEPRSNLRSEESGESSLHIDDSHDIEMMEDHSQVHGECGCPGVSKHPGHPAKPKFKKPGDINRSKCPPQRYCLSDCERAGEPTCVAPWAQCSISDHYSAWYVGGGTPFFGRGKCRDEGTWGLDYTLLKSKFVWLHWTHGRPQGGEGAYKTDGGPGLLKH